MSLASGPGSPSWLPLLDSIQVYSYFVAASSVVVAYDWALTFGQEVELVWVSSVPYHKCDRTTRLIRGRGNAFPSRLRFFSVCATLAYYMLLSLCFPLFRQPR